MVLKNFGDLVPGDRVMGAHGHPVTVVRTYDEHLPETMYRLEFDNGKTIEASGNHLWYCESSLDRSLHRQRLKEGPRLLKTLPEGVEEQLLELAESEEEVDVRLIDMVAMLHAEEDRVLTQVLVRVAESLGHIAEENTAYEDLYSGEEVGKTTLRTYDARLFAQQLLSLRDKKLRKRWPVVVGQVLTTEQLLLKPDHLDFPEVRQLKKVS